MVATYILQFVSDTVHVQVMHSSLYCALFFIGTVVERICHLVIVIALRISTVSKRGDIEDKTLEFSPTFTHQVFGDR